jgi:chemotaxis protein MotB
MKPQARGRGASHDRWLVSYADFITLLFAFFVVMYAFAKADQKKQQQVSASIDAAFKSMGMPIPPVPEEQPVPDPSAVVNDDLLSPGEVRNDLDRIHRVLNGTLAGQLKAGSVSIAMGPDGLVISLREAGFFDSGSALPKPETLPTLRKIAATLAGSPYSLRIEGDTDSVPIHTADFDSNWELSTARATCIARLFLALNAVSPERLSAAGYAEFHPVATNSTPQGRALNRRVDVVILPRTRINLAATPSTSSTGPWRKITDGDDTASQPVSKSAGQQ